MPITAPAAVESLLEVYDDIAAQATDLVGAATAIAPAAVRDIVCAAGGLGSLLGGPLGPYQGPGGFARTASDLGGILQASCPLPPAPPQFFPTQGPPPFAGGQCVGVSYRVDYTQQFEVSPGQPDEQTVTSSGFTIVNGPIGQYSGPTPGDPSGNVSIGVTHQNGTFITLTSTPESNPRYSAFSVIRRDGGADNCGDPPGPEIPPPPVGPIPDQPQSPVIPPEIPNPIIPGGGGFTFKPEVGPIFIGPDGGINVPVVVNIGGPSLNIPITIPVNVSLPDFSPVVVIGGNGGISGGNPPVAPPTPPPPVCCEPIPVIGPVADGEGDEPVEGDDPPPRGRIVGVVVSATVDESVASITELDQGGGALNLWVPRLASVYFSVKGGGAGSVAAPASTVDMPVKRLRQYVPAPIDVVVTGYRVVPEPGVTVSVSPVVVTSNRS